MESDLILPEPNYENPLADYKNVPQKNDPNFSQNAKTKIFQRIITETIVMMTVYGHKHHPSFISSRILRKRAGLTPPGQGTYNERILHPTHILPAARDMGIPEVPGNQVL